MTKLILEEHGKRRAFKLGDGVLTVGSGEGAKLRVESRSVADVHLDLELKGDRLVVKARPGVLPARVGGEELKGERTIGHGVRVEVGDATFWIEVEGAAAVAAATAPAVPAKRQLPKRVATPGRDRSLVQSSRPRVRRGMPSWLLASIVLAAAVVGLALFVRAFQSSTDAGSSPVWASIQAAEQSLDESLFPTAEKWLDRITDDLEPTAEQRTRVAELRKEIERRRAESDVAVANLTGTRYLEVMLKKHEQKWLSGDPEPAKVRYFLKRLAEFRRRWPSHPDMDWVERQEARFKGVVDLAAPPTWDEVAWEITCIRVQHVREYSVAYALLDDFERNASRDELLEAADLRREMDEERRAYFQDRIYQAEYEYNKKENPDQAVWWLLNLTVYIGDEEMANAAAEFLVQVPNLEEHLDDYKRKYPERYALVLRHPLIGAKARSF